MKKSKRREATATTDIPAAARGKLVTGYRKLATVKKYTEAERAEFARMADSWAATLPKE